jgi:hypothetical protein
MTGPSTITFCFTVCVRAFLAQIINNENKPFVVSVGESLNRHCYKIYRSFQVKRGRIMSFVYPNPAEHEANLRQFFQKVENNHKYNVRSSSKCVSTRSCVKPPRVPSKTDAALLKRANKSPLNSPKNRERSSVLRDPKLELERQRNLENRQKYSPSNLKLARKPHQSPIPKANPKELEATAKVCARESILYYLFLKVRI